MDEQQIVNEIAFSQPVINIGSNRGNDIILNGEGVSGFHVMLNYDASSWNLVPIDPNGRTLINERMIDPAGCIVNNGSVLSIGTYKLRLSLNGMNADIIIEKTEDAAADESPAVYEEAPGQNILLGLTEGSPLETPVGTTVEYTLTVTNAGPLVANMQLQLQGVPADWVQIIPPVLNLNEGRKGTFTVRVTPPQASEARAGLYHLHFVAISPNYQMETAAVNTVLTILPYSDFLASGPMPRRLNLNRRHPEDTTDIVIDNNANAPETYLVRASDDSAELLFSYLHDGENTVQGQIPVTVQPGESARVPLRVGTRKRPIIGMTGHLHHYNINISPMEHPVDAQSLLGEVNIRPLIHTGWLLLALLLLLIAAVFAFQPYIRDFSGSSGKRTEVIVSGRTTNLKWNVSPFATMITLDDGTGAQTITRSGNRYISPTAPVTYTIRAENFISKLLNIQHEHTLSILTIPARPSVDRFTSDTDHAYYESDVNLSWAVSEDSDRATIVANKQTTELKPEEYSGNKTAGYREDTLFSLRAENSSGYEMKSLFLNVLPDQIDLVRFIAWVRPSGIAIPENNDVRRSTRWSTLSLFPSTTQPQTIKPAGSSQPAPQSNVLQIPDDFMGAGSSAANMNPEQQALSGSTNVQNSTYQPVTADSAAEGLLVSPALLPTPTAIPAPVVEIPSALPRPTAVPPTAPEALSSTGDFSIKLAEVVEDPSQPSGYRTISYFPGYVLQKGEQVMIDWEVKGVSGLKIENLSTDTLTPSGGEYMFPEKSVNLVLNAEVGSIKKAYTLPILVAGDPDNGEDSGSKCELKANATELKVPGSVMLTWTNGGNNRVQLISSAKAESDSEKEEKEKAKKAKEEGKDYKTPENNPMSGGIIGDYLQPSGFMRVNVDKQTTFILNAYDANGKVICTKNAVVNFAGGNDKKDLKFEISKIADKNNESQPVYTVGQTIQYTTRLWDYTKGKDPTGTIMVTDGFSTCSMTYPVTTCSIVAKQTGEPLKVTAVYSGDDTYKKKTATGYVTVVEKEDTETKIPKKIESAETAGVPTKVSPDRVALWTYLIYGKVEDGAELAEKYKITPTGTITLTAGKESCTLDILSLKLTCTGTSSGDADYVSDTSDKTRIIDIYKIPQMLLKDTGAQTIVAKYEGDDYYNPSQSELVPLISVPTELSIEASRPDDIEHVNLSGVLSWDEALNLEKRTPSGTIKFTFKQNEVERGNCSMTLPSGKLTCEPKTGDVKDAESGKQQFEILSMLLDNKMTDRIIAEYSGDGYFGPSASTTVKFVDNSIPTTIDISGFRPDDEEHVNVNAVLKWDDALNPQQRTPSGTVKFTFKRNSSELGSCTMNLSDGSLTCEPKTGTAEISGDGQMEIKVIKMLLDDKSVDRMIAEYSGDGYFGPSSSTTVKFAENSVTLDLKIFAVQTVDGKDYPGEQFPYYVMNENVMAVVDLQPISNEIQIKPTGTIKITVPGEPPTTCTVTWGGDPYCKVKLPASEGEVTVTAVYSGDGNYASTNADTIVDVRDKLPIKLDIVKWTDKNGAEQSEYYKGETIRVYVEIPGYEDLSLKPTGKITVSLGSGTCTITNYKDVQYCEITAPMPTTTEVTQDWDVNAVIEADTYYNSANAKTQVLTVVNKKPIDLDIKTIANEYGVTQPYFVYDDKAGTGQTVKVYAGLIDYPEAVPPDPNGIISIWLDKDDGTSDKMCEYNWTDQSCTFQVKKPVGEYTLRAHYDGDTNYVKRDTTKPFTTAYRITTDTFIQSAQAMLVDPTLAKVELQLAFPREFPDAHGVSPAVDETTGTTKDGNIKLTFTEKDDDGNPVLVTTCDFNMNSKTLGVCQLEETTIDVKEPEDGNYYTLSRVNVFSDTYTEVKAEYEGNTYFYPSSDEFNYGKEDLGLTSIEITDALILQDEIIYFDAVLTYDTAISEKYGVQPAMSRGKLTVTAGSTTCVYDFVTGWSDSSCYSFGVEKNPSDGSIKLRGKALLVTGAPSSVTVSYAEDNEYYWSCNASKELTPEHPKVTVTSAKKHDTTSGTVAEVELNVSDCEKSFKFEAFYEIVFFASNSSASYTAGTGDHATYYLTYSKWNDAYKGKLTKLSDGSYRAKWQRVGWHTINEYDWCWVALAISYQPETKFPAGVKAFTVDPGLDPLVSSSSGASTSSFDSGLSAPVTISVTIDSMTIEP